MVKKMRTLALLCLRRNGIESECCDENCKKRANEICAKMSVC